MMIYTLAVIVFWLSAWLIFYIYVGYALFVFALGRLKGEPVKKKNIEPCVSIIITAYNEAKSIRAKIENTLLIDYPSEKLEIIVASDGSTDETDRIVQEFSGSNVRLFRQEGRVGKTATQNAAVEAAAGEIILFSDATTIYSPDVLYSLVPNFADPSVGCAAGRLIYVNHSSSRIGSGARSYWNYETFLKKSESLACSLIGVSGCLYAVRKAAYVPMYPEACSDFLICTVMYRQGLRSIYEPSAVCTEQTNARADREFEMRVRIIAQTFTDLWRNRDMLNPLKSGFYAIELISHKVLRYSAPIFLFLILISSIFLAFGSLFFVIVLAVQALFYLAAFGAWIMESKNVKLGLLASPFYFVLTNVSSAVGFYKFLRGERYARWETAR